jgi:1-aminocyclopropane-1-carboxylate deaminase/D-cysteine desulfhydrase-like pyridoxal-dependent ACC family enzyme
MNSNLVSTSPVNHPLSVTNSLHEAMDRFLNLKRLRLTNLSTPIERADRLRSLIPGAPQLYLKRDDLSGYFGGGNKLRKLEYVMADALEKGATTVLTGRSLQIWRARLPP